MQVFRIFSIVLFVSTLLACGGGGGDGRENPDLSTEACGTLGLNPKIVNGTSCTPLSNSPVVRVVLQEGDGARSFCSGTMITQRDVLTAGHCFLDNPTKVSILSGETLQESREFVARSWVVHPRFNPGGSLLFNDVAIVQLGDNTGLPTVPVLRERPPFEGEVGAIFGYGTDENGDFDFQDLRSGEMLISETTSDHIRAEFDGKGSNTCTGDSGGPIIVQERGFSVIAGLTSSGIKLDCSEGDSTFFTNVQDETNSTFIARVAPDTQFR